MNQEIPLTYILTALQEDIGDGDHSTLSCIEANAQGKAVLRIKEKGIIAGVEIAEIIFRQLDPNTEFIKHLEDGALVTPGQTAFEVSASIHAILQAERLVLNIMQRMSGIATLTHLYVEKLTGYHTRLLDTRKTTPNFRWFEKRAVQIGGGYNHRMGLYDMIMLKDNHIDYCGSIEKAIEKAKAYVLLNKPGMKIEVETRNLSDVERVLAVGGVDRIMLDNFNPELLGAAVGLIGGRYETEASGGITIDNLQAYAATEVDFISCGAIIHHAVSMDLSLKAVIR